MDMIERRALLHGKTNPDRKLDYVITLSSQFSTCNQAQQVVLRYIPDRFILDGDAFAQYLEAIDKVTWNSPEDVAVAVLCDVNNEIIGRWVQVSLEAPLAQGSALSNHAVVLEDRQPGWDNPSLLGRLKRI